MTRKILGLITTVTLLAFAGCIPSELHGEVDLEAVNLNFSSTSAGTGHFDLDRGVFDAEGRGDILLTEGAGSGRFFSVSSPNEAKAEYYGTIPPEQNDCLEILEDDITHDVPQIAVGGYICVLTTEGNIARLLIEDLDSGFPARMSLNYTIWFAEEE